jgi:hypothetical protein
MRTGRGETEVEVDRGQFIFGRKTASDELKMNPETVRKRMEKLKKSKNLTIQSTRHYSIVSIANWDAYQGTEEDCTTQDTNQVPTKYQPSTTDKNDKKEKKEIIRQIDPPKPTSIYPENFLAFWALYPKKVGKGAALKAYQKIKEPKPTLKTIKESIAWQVTSENWKDPQFIPHPSTWLNERRWEDEPTTPINGKAVCQPSIEELLK